MNIDQLRHSLKAKWLTYYQQNRSWLVQLQVWASVGGQRRPASSFILATVSSLEPELTELLPFIVALSNDPDQIVSALGLSFDPDEELKLMPQELQLTTETLVAAETDIDFNGLTEAEPETELVAENEENDLHLSTQTFLDDEKEASLATTDPQSDYSSEIHQSSNSEGKHNYAGIVLSILAAISLTWIFVGFTG